MSEAELPRRLRRLRLQPKKQVSNEKSEMLESLLAQTDEAGRSDLKRKTTDLALREIGHFRERHERYPTGSEFDEISESIYRQLREAEEKREQKKRQFQKPRKERERGISPLERRRRRMQKLEEKEEKAEEEGKEGEEEFRLEEEEEGAAAEEAGKEEGGVEALFAKEEKGEGREALSLRELAESDELVSLGNALEGMTDDSDAIEHEIETSRNKCPNCKSKTENMIFCPECGAGFCTYCAARIEVLGDKVKYVCPSCRKEFSVRKLAK